MARKIIIAAKRNGEVSVRTEGYVGTACKSASQPYEAALGTQTSDTATPEQFETPMLTQDA